MVLKAYNANIFFQPHIGSFKHWTDMHVNILQLTKHIYSIICSPAGGMWEKLISTSSKTKTKKKLKPSGNAVCSCDRWSRAHVRA